MILQRFEAPIPIACFFSIKPEKWIRRIVFWLTTENSWWRNETCNHRFKKRLKACKHSIKNYFYNKIVDENYVQVFLGPGGYPHPGYPYSRPSNMPPGARAGAVVFAKRQTRPARTPCSARRCRLGFPAAMKSELVLISECCFRDVLQLKL